eukprot:15334126-Ditylum_brightwellii.AAC.2
MWACVSAGYINCTVAVDAISCCVALSKLLGLQGKLGEEFGLVEELGGQNVLFIGVFPPGYYCCNGCWELYRAAPPSPLFLDALFFSKSSERGGEEHQK